MNARPPFVQLQISGGAFSMSSNNLYGKGYVSLRTSVWGLLFLRRRLASASLGRRLAFPPPFELFVGLGGGVGGVGGVSDDGVGLATALFETLDGMDAEAKSCGPNKCSYPSGLRAY